MNILGIDYGEKKIGLAIGYSESKFAEPLMVVKYVNEKKVLEKICQVSQVERVGKVVIGVSEGKTAEKTKEFGLKLGKALVVPIEYFDETLSTREAQELAIQSGMKRKKRKDMEDALAASVMLQKYLEAG